MKAINMAGTSAEDFDYLEDVEAETPCQRQRRCPAGNRNGNVQGQHRHNDEDYDQEQPEHLEDALLAAARNALGWDHESLEHLAGMMVETAALDAHTVEEAADAGNPDDDQPDESDHHEGPPGGENGDSPDDPIQDMDREGVLVAAGLHDAGPSGAAEAFE